MDVLDLVAKIKMDMTEYDEGLDKAEEKAKSSGSSIGGALSKLIGGGAKALAAATTVAATGVAALTTASVNAYAEYQQLEGGVKKLYGNMGMSLEEYAKSVGKSTDEVKDKYNDLEKAQNLVIDNAKKAYQTSGMSMNQYMETATSFSAKLINDLGGDTVKAAELTDTAMQAISDNFNTFGGDIGMIQGAFQGFAKGNYMMLDNLKLGYGGTKTEMERLIADANEYAASIGKASDLTIDSFADQIEAIQLIQEKQQIAGTTQREAATTIEGALNMTKSAWQNLLTAMGNGEEDITGYIDNLVSSVSTLGKNIMPVVEQALVGVSQLIGDLVPVIVDGIPNLINEVLPKFLESGAKIIQSILTGISQNAGTIASGLSDILVTLAQQVVQMLPQFIEAGVKLLIALANGISQALPSLVPTIVQAVMSLVQTIVEHLPELIDAGIQIAQALLEGIIEAIPQIIEALPDLIDAIITTLTESSDAIMQGALEMFMAIVDAIPDIMDALVKALPDIVDSIVKFLTGDGLPKIIAGAVDMFMGIIKAIPDIVVAIGQNMPDIINAVATGLIEGGANLLAAAGDFLWNIITAIGNFLGDLWEEAKKIGEKIINAIKDIPEKMYKLGRDIVLGLWNGIKSIAASQFGDEMATKVNAMYSRAKAAAESNSPSKKFARLGRDLVRGLEIGWEDEYAKFDKELSNDMNFGEGTIGLNVQKSFDTAETITASSAIKIKLSDEDIDKIARKLSITMYNTTEIDSLPIKEEMFKYTVDRIGDETQARKIAHGGAY